MRRPTRQLTVQLAGVGIVLVCGAAPVLGVPGGGDARRERAVLRAAAEAYLAFQQHPGCVAIEGLATGDPKAEGGSRQTLTPVEPELLRGLRRTFPDVKTVSDAACPDPLVVLRVMSWDSPSQAYVKIAFGADRGVACKVRHRFLRGWHVEHPCQSLWF